MELQQLRKYNSLYIHLWGSLYSLAFYSKFYLHILYCLLYHFRAKCAHSLLVMHLNEFWMGSEAPRIKRLKLRLLIRRKLLAEPKTWILRILDLHVLSVGPLFLRESRALWITEWILQTSWLWLPHQPFLLQSLHVSTISKRSIRSIVSHLGNESQFRLGTGFLGLSKLRPLAPWVLQWRLGYISRMTSATWCCRASKDSP